MTDRLVDGHEECRSERDVLQNEVHMLRLRIIELEEQIKLEQACDWAPYRREHDSHDKER